MSALLLDAGPLIAILDRSDPSHEWVRRRFAAVCGRVITTGAVITEVTFFLNDVKQGIRRLADFIETSKTEIWDCFNVEALRSAEQRIIAYLKTPMDFADATLVLAAEHYQTGDIATLDERGFRTFRYGPNKPFRLVLQEMEMAR